MEHLHTVPCRFHGSAVCVAEANETFFVLAWPREVLHTVQQAACLANHLERGQKEPCEALGLDASWMDLYGHKVKKAFRFLDGLDDFCDHRLLAMLDQLLHW